ncbi:MAG: hypothetical protein EOP45_20300 [Sphingobacteriaceae bacterium]|nr:MAG: hypothetical protein EOP45_20300 [Sphingobacteriaceae bacterium]
MCIILQVSKTSYYEWLGNRVSKRAERYNLLDHLIETIFAEHQGRYGSTRIYHELKYRNIACTRRFISKRMKLLGLVSKVRRKFKVTRIPNIDGNNQKHFFDREYYFPITAGRISANPKLEHENPGY